MYAPLELHAAADNLLGDADRPVAIYQEVGDKSELGFGLRNVASILRAPRSFVREFPSQERPGLLLCGDTGTGKTHLAVAALKAIIDKGHEGIFFDYQNLLDRIRSGYDAASGAADREAYRAVLDVEVLLLDDLGARQPSVAATHREVGLGGQYVAPAAATMKVQYWRLMKQ